MCRGCRGSLPLSVRSGSDVMRSGTVCVSMKLKGVQLGSGLGLVQVSRVHSNQTQKILLYALVHSDIVILEQKSVALWLSRNFCNKVGSLKCHCMAQQWCFENPVTTFAFKKCFISSPNIGFNLPSACLLCISTGFAFLFGADRLGLIDLNLCTSVFE